MANTEFDGIRFSVEDGRLERLDDRRNVTLRPQVAKLLEVLLAHAGQVVGRDMLCREIWGEDRIVDFESGLAALVKELRRELRQLDLDSEILETMPRRGYRLNASEPARDRRRRGMPKGARLAGLAALVIILLAASWFWWPDRDRDAESALAILPFEIYDETDALPEHLDLLLADALLARLWQLELEQLVLIGRTSMLPYAGRADVGAAVARDLDVNLLLEGGLVSDADGWRIDSRLLLMPGGRVIWSERVEGSSDQPIDTAATAAELAERLGQAWPTIRPQTRRLRRSQ